jgi:hypothetical protein
MPAQDREVRTVFQAAAMVEDRCTAPGLLL